MKNSDELLRDVATVPNGVTTARLLAVPWLYKRMLSEPANNWGKAMVFAVSDNVDGTLARLEDRHPRLAKFGFRRSETGRKLDPLVDKIFTASQFYAGIKNKTVPKSFGAAAIAQKVAVSALTIDSELRHQEATVSNTGKIGEFVTNWATGGLVMSSSVENPVYRRGLRVVSGALGAVGLALSTTATVGYARQSGRLPQQPTTFEGNVETVCTKLVQLPSQLVDGFRSNE